jgi:hypothetical protein
MTILSTILGVETSGGHNILQGNIGDVNNTAATAAGSTFPLAQGYFQITGPTWQRYGGLATGYPTALSAPPAVQAQIAQNIPVNQWGPATQRALAQNGYTYTGNETLGQMMATYNETPSMTTAADGATFSSGGGGVTASSFDSASGLTSPTLGSPTGTGIYGYTGDPTSAGSGAPNGDWVGTGSAGGDAPDSPGFTVGPNTPASGGTTWTTTTNPDGSVSYASAPSGGPLSSTGAPPGLSTIGTGNFGSLSSASANNATTDATPVSPITGNPITPNAPAGAGVSPNTAPQGNDQGTPNLGGGVSQAGGAPIDLTDASNVGTKAASTISQGATNAANTLSKAAGGLTSGLGSDTSSVESTGTGWLNSIFGDVNNTLVRTGFVLAGLVVLLLAGVFFYLDSQKGSGPNVQVVPLTV